MGFSEWHSEDALLPEFAFRMLLRQEHLRLSGSPWKLLEMTVRWCHWKCFNTREVAIDLCIKNAIQ